jgi:hypothetical protein
LWRDARLSLNLHSWKPDGGRVEACQR